MDNYSTYPSSLLVVSPTGIYRKHYYIGSQRIASRVGDGIATIFEGTPGGGGIQAKKSQQADSTASELEELKTLQQQDLLYYAAKAGIKTLEYAPYETPNLSELTEEADNGMKSAAAVPTYAIYYYHPDHLGSNTLITNTTGLPYQLFLNLPYGETMAEQTTSTGTWQSPYKFNGKELDAETGLYYYGARYYDAKASVWLSVDPLAEKYPSVSPYTYCLNNPVVLVDPNGESPTLITGAIGFGVGALIGGAIEMGTQLYKNGTVSNWSAVGGSALQGGITGGAAGLTGGASLLTTALVSGGANVVGGTVNRAIQGNETSFADVSLDFTIGVIIGAAAKYIATPSGAGLIKGGSWISTKESMSAAASRYQTYITGQAANKSFLLRGVKFDGVMNNVLVDAKSGYGNFVNKSTGAFYSWFKGSNSLISQAERQIEAANGAKIQWFFENKSAMEATRKLFQKEGIKGIELINKTIN